MDQASKLEALLTIHVKQFDELKLIMQAEKLNTEKRITALEKKIIELQIKSAESSTKLAIIWAFFTTIICGIVGLAVGIKK